MLSHVINRPQQTIDRIVKGAETSIAVPAQQPTHFLGPMIVIDVREIASAKDKCHNDLTAESTSRSSLVLRRLFAASWTTP
jgi:hypothetical protein